MGIESIDMAKAKAAEIKDLLSQMDTNGQF